MELGLAFAAGLVAGGFLVYLITRLHRKDVEQAFSSLASDALRNNSEDFLKRGVSEIDNKKKLIDQTLETMNSELQRVKQCVIDFDGKSGEKFSKVSEQLRNATEQTVKLQDTTYKLQSALANTKERGQWGERMAEDVLRLAGFIEGTNYVKQKTQDNVTSRPDYTFLLPQELKLNMDVKFPFNNYTRYAAEENKAVQDAYKQEFLKDVRKRIKEVTTRDYINPQEKTLDYVLVFVPNEQVYCFINENDGAVMDDALKSKVVLCSPLTLYAILAIIWQTVDNFNLSKTASHIMMYLGEFEKQWHEYSKCMDAMGERIEAAHKEYQKLTTTRTNTLERSLKRIDDLRSQQAISTETDPSLSLPAENQDAGEGLTVK
jgi:DNA recombination protein RmuC